MKILKNVFLLTLAIIVSYLFSAYFGLFFKWIMNDTSLAAGFINLVGLPLAYLFLLSLLFTLFGGHYKYWWIGIGAIPALVMEVYLDPTRIYFPVLLGLLGWAIGFAIHKLVLKFRS